MNKYKTCPSCGAENAPSDIECLKCGTDLMAVPVVDASMHLPSGMEERELQDDGIKLCVDQQTSPQPQYVRVCTCGAVNPPNARECGACGADISVVMPTLRNQAYSVHYTLEEVGGGYIFRIPCGCIVVGREHAMRECLASKQYVSRIHAKLTVDDGVLYVENLSSTNYTFINNIKIPGGRSRAEVGDEISFGGISVNGERQTEAAYFIVGTAL